MIRIHVRGFHGVPTLPEKLYSVLGSIMSMATRDLMSGRWSELHLVIDDLDGPTSIALEYERIGQGPNVALLVERIKTLFNQRFAFAIPVDIRPVIATS